MDIAKYVLTAVIISTAFSGMGEIWMYVIAGIIVTATVGLGLWLIREKGGMKYMSNNEIGFLIMCGTIMLIAITGFLYFYIKDKKEERRHAN